MGDKIGEFCTRLWDPYFGCKIRGSCFSERNGQNACRNSDSRLQNSLLLTALCCKPDSSQSLGMTRERLTVNHLEHLASDVVEMSLVSDFVSFAVGDVEHVHHLIEIRADLGVADHQREFVQLTG